MVPFLRIYDASIYNYLKYQVLPPHFTEVRTDEPLTFSPTANGYVVTTDAVPLPTSEGRGWAVFDETTVNGKLVVDLTAEQQNQITVTGASSYTVDYVNGRILNPDTPPSSITYAWYYVSVVQGWPGTEPPPLPVVALDIDENIKSGFQLGGGTKDVIEGSVYVFATNEGEKKDITDIIYQAFFNRSLPIQNWHEGSYLDYDGTFSGFSPSPVSGITNGVFTETQAFLRGPRMDWSELNRYRSRVSFTFEVLKDD